MKKPDCYHRVEIIVGKGTTRGYELAKCMDCKWYHYILPGVTAIGNLWRCNECRQIFKVDREAAKQVLPVCMMCDFKKGNVKRFYDYTEEASREKARLDEEARIKALDAQDLKDIDDEEDE